MVWFGWLIGGLEGIDGMVVLAGGRGLVAIGLVDGFGAWSAW